MASSVSRRRTASAFDIRLIIAALFFLYGVVLTVMGATSGAATAAKSAGVNVNLWTGIGLLVFAVLLAGWAWLRPVPVPTSGDEQDAAEH